ncbi:MAG TPA: hypothetical protein VE129_10985 [Thermoanaerobaculia bacterium]|nr:hypothetical protein [Thermoanaerobaculia bacterium]
MYRSHRWIALFAIVAVAGGAVGAPADSPVKRLGKTVVQHKDSNVRAVLSWRYANQTFEKEPWLLLELAFAAEGRAVDLNREDVSLLTPAGEKLPLPGQKRLGEGIDVRWVQQKASVSRDPITGYFPNQRLEQRIPFFTYPGGPVVLDEIGGGPTMLSRGDIFFESPVGAWKPGRYTLVLKNKKMDVELPFSLPAADSKMEEKGPDGKTVPW